MKFSVKVPIAGIAYCEVEADSEDEAIDAALGAIDDPAYIEEWSAYKELVRGNVLYAPCNKAEATKIEGDDE